MNIDEFMQKYGDSIKDGIIREGCIGDFFDLILESNRAEKREIMSYIRLMYHHMLKYLYQKDHQTGSWIKTIRNCYRYLEEARYETKYIWNSICDEDLIRQYINGRKDAIIETKLNDNIFPKEFPSDYFELDNISESTKMEKFLIDNVETWQAKKYLNL